MNTPLLSANNAEAKLIPTRTFQFNGWDRLPITWRSLPVYVNLSTGDWAYEAEGCRLVTMPEEVVEAILDVRLLDWAYQEMSAEARDWLRQRAS